MKQQNPYSTWTSYDAGQALAMDFKNRGWTGKNNRNYMLLKIDSRMPREEWTHYFHLTDKCKWCKKPLDKLPVMWIVMHGRMWRKNQREGFIHPKCCKELVQHIRNLIG